MELGNPDRMQICKIVVKTVGGNYMGFFNEDVGNSFDAMFDENRDGILDESEQAYRSTYLDNESDDKDPWDDSITNSASSYYSSSSNYNKSDEVPTAAAIAMTVISFIITAIILMPFDIDNCPKIVILIVWLLSALGIFYLYEKLKR